MDVARLWPRSRGVTLLELLTTLSTGLVLLGIGIPGWRVIVESNAVSTSRSQFQTVLAQGRMLAVKNQLPATICPTRDGDSCNGDFEAWHQGYILFVDRDGSRQREGDEPVIRWVQQVEAGVIIHSSSGRRSIRFDGDGNAWGSNVSLRFCGPSGERSNKALILYGSGRARRSDTLPGGDPVVCEDLS